MTSLIYRTAGELAAAIRKRETTSEKVVQAHLERIHAYNDELNAIVILTADEALRQARDADKALESGQIRGSLHGVPVTIKESFNIAGLKTTSNFKPLKNNVAQEDALLVTRLKNAGAVILGKTNLPMLCADYQAFGPLYKRANNPYNTGCTTGGSTGGGAAAVASGMSPLEFGSDLGGSVRVPAHFCGLYSLKPTEFNAPITGHVPPLPNAKGGVKHMAQFGPLARSIDDLRIAFEIITGPDYRDVRSAPVNWERPRKKEFSSYRVAWTDTFREFRADRDTCGIMKNLVEKIGNANVQAVKTDLSKFDIAGAWDVWGTIFGFFIGQDLPWPVRLLLKIQYRAVYGTHFSRSAINGLNVNFLHYARVIKQRDALIAQLQTFFENYDFLLCPVTMAPAFTHRKSGKPIEVDGVKVPYLVAVCAFATPFNATGNPVVVIPAGQSRDGLPIGIQIVGPYWSDLELLAFAEQISGLTEGFVPPPKYSI